MATELPIDFELVKRTYRISVKYNWLSSPFREKLSKFLLDHGAHKVKRTGSGSNQHLYVSWNNEGDNERSEQEIKSLMEAAISMFIEGKEKGAV